MAKTYIEALQEIVEKYRHSDEAWPATLRQIAAWALSKGLWKPQPASLISQCAEDLGRAMREEYFTDSQGRTVRAKHAARVTQGGEQTSIWADIRTASREHMATAFQQRRQLVFGECRQLKSDVDSYNENGRPVEPIQVSFNFSEDLAEAEALRRREVSSSISRLQPSMQSQIAVRR